MSLQIGQITGLNEPTSVTQNGNHVSLAGSYKAATLADGLMKREQFLGYADNHDEPVIPVIRDGDTRFTAYYRVLSVEVTTDEFSLKQGNIYDYRFELERVQSPPSSTLESIIVGALMPNDFAILAATAEPFHAFPNTATEYLGLIPTYPSPIVRPNSSGVNAVVQVVFVASTYNGIARYSVPLSDHYRGACRILDATDSHVLIGTREAPTHPLLENGITRLDLGTGTLTNGDAWHYYVWTGSAWALCGPTSASNVGFTINPLSALLQNGQTIRVLRNSPEECIVRLVPQYAPAGASVGPYTIDISLRRGSRVVKIFVASANTETFGIGCLGGNPMAATAITGGIRSTANDPSGNRLVFMTARNFTTNLTQGIITANAAKTTFDCGVAVEYPGGTVNAKETAQDMVYQYLASQSETMRVVGH